ncbi:hypothetical protein B5F53_02355 [Blautia sp. An249]|uniref:heparan-alpha-glucosaminide N-acetyltransferase domain-containing protein n=1 Tax=Blautia sp. An249 TaxID=1965603 RepID=UPI000B3AAA67|nr:heparan-alpha-glucosaminide N-acetyltransferase domain-containing protein [Blautia sp. An249]OUO80579.1 hypothetical protein B5F53_02355 [Blautia sp. An249]
MQTALRQRFYLIDALRGFAVFHMIAYHLCYDIFVIFGRSPQWFQHPPVILWERFICCTFILIAGISWHWGRRHNLRRGLLLNGFGLLLTLITWLILPDSLILFGILNFLGCAVLLLILLDPVLSKISPRVGVCVSFLLFLFFYPVTRHFLGFGNLSLIQVPEFLYEAKFLAPLGFPSAHFYSSDYFPLLPWFFLFCAGYFLNPILTNAPRLRPLLCRRLPILTKAGQHSLLLYLVHQPLCMLLCILFFS